MDNLSHEVLRFRTASRRLSQDTVHILVQNAAIGMGAVSQWSQSRQWDSTLTGEFKILFMIFDFVNRRRNYQQL